MIEPEFSSVLVYASVLVHRPQVIPIWIVPVFATNWEIGPYLAVAAISPGCSAPLLKLGYRTNYELVDDKPNRSRSFHWTLVFCAWYVIEEADGGRLVDHNHVHKADNAWIAPPASHIRIPSWSIPLRSLNFHLTNRYLATGQPRQEWGRSAWVPYMRRSNVADRSLTAE